MVQRDREDAVPTALLRKQMADDRPHVGGPRRRSGLFIS